MLVVIPVCQKDEELALKNLDWIAELDGKIRAKASVIWPDSTRAPDCLVEKARSIFDDVLPFSYPEWSGDMRWPQPQNWAWQSAVRLVGLRELHSKQPWLWMEPDSTVISKGWYDAIRQEYEEGGKPFMGCLMEGDGHMNGVAVYPHNVFAYSQNSALCRQAPFDVFMWKEIAPFTHQANHLIQHHCRENGDSTYFPDQASVEAIVRPGVVLFHRCKDGSLIDRLREARPGGVKKLFAKVQGLFSTSETTVVITNFSRPDKVKHAFESCLKANVEHVIVSASGCGSELKAVHEQFKRDKPNVVIDSIPGDLGCNEMWLRGARLVKTKWVNLLHDDDMLTPEFETLEKYLAQNVGFFHWDGAKHAWPDTLLKGSKPIQRTFDNRHRGIFPTSILWPTLLTPGGYSISPVSALFPRDHVIDCLEEVEREFADCRFFWGPKMQVGNDLLLWLRAVENFPNFYYIPRPLISYGHWDGSVTFNDFGNALGLLAKIYDHTRDYFLCGPPFDMLNSRGLVHIQSNYLSADETPRVQFAKRLWAEQYRKGHWTREGIDDNALPRLFKDGNRELPYLRDMIDQAVNKHGDEPIYVLTNTDTIPTPSLTRHLQQTFKTHEACYSFRRDISGNEKRDERSIRMQSAVYPGCDLFAFNKRWWMKARKTFPDMLYATDTWDYCLHKYMDSTGAKRFYHAIYHVVHGCELHRNKGSLAHQHNHELAAPFLTKLGIEPFWLSDKPVNLNPR